MKQTKRVLEDRLRRLERQPVGASGGSGVTDHGDLTGLADDDHAQYLNTTRGDARYSQLGHTHSYETAGAVAGHEAAADPHPQYLTAVEGDAAYSLVGHTHPGATIVSGVVTITVPYPGRYEWEETVVATGVVSTNKVFLTIGHHEDSDENHEAGLAIASMGGQAGTDAIIVNVAFAEYTAGPIKLNYMVV